MSAYTVEKLVMVRRQSTRKLIFAENRCILGNRRVCTTVANVKGHCRPTLTVIPTPLLQARIKDLDDSIPLVAVCVGYEQGEWRCQELARHLLLDWLLQFALPPERHKDVTIENAGEQLRRAVEVIYATDKYERRGEFGEVLLYAILRQEYGTTPAISKIFLKSSVNETVKGFDAVHVVSTDTDLELWLGEVKFHNSIRKAIYDVVRELRLHLASDYLRKEFILIANKVSDELPFASKLKRLLNANTSLDEVFPTIRIPVLLTYDSDTIGGFTSVCDEFVAAFSAEVRKHHASFKAANPPEHLKLHLILMPLKSKALLQRSLDEKLKAIGKV